MKEVSKKETKLKQNKKPTRLSRFCVFVDKICFRTSQVYQALMDFERLEQARQGAPQVTDDGYLGIVEVVNEEQRSIVPL